MVISDEVYDRLSFVPFTRIAQLSPEMWNLTLTVGSAGKTFYATGWRVGFLIGPKTLIEGVAAAHRSICFATPNSSQEALAIAYEDAESNGFWKYTKESIETKMHRFNEIWDELGLPVSVSTARSMLNLYGIPIVRRSRWRLLCPREHHENCCPR